MKTKYYVTFLNHVHNYETDIELADIINISISNKRLADPIKLFSDLDELQHPKLAKKSNCDKNRLLTVRHMKATLYETFIKELYEEVTMYLRSLLRVAAIKGYSPKQLIGENTKIEFTVNEILASGSWDIIAQKSADKIYQQLESEKSTLNLIMKINNKLGLDIHPDVITDAIPYLNIRHFLVHEDGILSDDFKKQYPFISCMKNNRVDLNYVNVCTAKDKIIHLVRVIDRKAVKFDYIPQNEIQR